MTTTSRLGETLVGSTHKAPHLDEVSLSEHSSHVATSLRLVSLAWARDQVAKKLSQLLGRDARPLNQ